MTDASPENHDDRAPQGANPSDDKTTTEVAEEASAPSNGAPSEPPAAESQPEAPAPDTRETPDGRASEAVADSDGPSAPEPEAASEESESEPERPAIGPVIIAEAPPEGAAEPTPSRHARGGRPGQDGADKPRRRRRRSAAERHRGVFFARLSELRRSERQAAAANTGDGEPPESPEEAAAAAPAAEEQAPEPQAEAPAEEQAPEPQAEAPAEETAAQPQETEGEPQVEVPPAAAEAQAEHGDDGRQQPQGQRSAPPPQVSRPRLISAIDRVGGPEVVQEALAPKQDEEGERLKWAQVCSDAARGLQPGDPAFAAWVRLAATPVRDVRGAVNDMLGIVEEPRGGQRRGGGGRRGGGRPARPGEWGGEGRARPGEVANFGRDGGLRTKIRIVGDDEEDRRQREERRKAQREAKRAAERERLARLGY